MSNFEVGPTQAQQGHKIWQATVRGIYLSDAGTCTWENIHRYQKPDGVAIPEKWLDCLRPKVVAFFARNLQGIDLDHVDELQTGTRATKVRGRLLHAWAAIVKDPGEKATSLFLKGAQLVWGWPDQ